MSEPNMHQMRGGAGSVVIGGEGPILPRMSSTAGVGNAIQCKAGRVARPSPLLRATAS